MGCIAGALCWELGSKQLSQDERIPRAGMPKGDQQGGFSGLVRLEGFGQTVGCIPIAYLQPLGAEHQG
jgi:hypothetical protein